MSNEVHVIMDEAAIRRALTRIAHEILERNKGIENCVLIGIKTRGEFLAKRLAGKILEIEGTPVPWGAIDVTAYRDDQKKGDPQASKDVNQELNALQIQEKKVILFDDVLYT